MGFFRLLDSWFQSDHPYHRDISRWRFKRFTLAENLKIFTWSCALVVWLCLKDHNSPSAKGDNPHRFIVSSEPTIGEIKKHFDTLGLEFQNLHKT